MIMNTFQSRYKSYISGIRKISIKTSKNKFSIIEIGKDLLAADILY
jgi:hypothetical protein